MTALALSSTQKNRNFPTDLFFSLRLGSKVFMVSFQIRQKKTIYSDIEFCSHTPVRASALARPMQKIVSRINKYQVTRNNLLLEESLVHSGQTLPWGLYKNQGCPIYRQFLGTSWIL